MTHKPRPVVAGVDTHKDTHYAAVISGTEPLAAAQFRATEPGYQALHRFTTKRRLGARSRTGSEGRRGAICQATVLSVAGTVRRVPRGETRSGARVEPCSSELVTLGLHPRCCRGRAMRPPLPWGSAVIIVGLSFELTRQSDNNQLSCGRFAAGVMGCRTGRFLPVAGWVGCGDGVMASNVSGAGGR